MPNYTSELGSVLSLMQIQNNYIKQIDKTIYALYTDFNLANNMEFNEFIVHFTVFGQNHFISQGFSKALDALQAYHYTLLEQLLDNQVLVAAEELELSIAHLEMVLREPGIRLNVQILLLSQGINIVEENLLKIVEGLEFLLEKCGKVQFEN